MAMELAPKMLQTGAILKKSLETLSTYASGDFLLSVTGVEATRNHARVRETVWSAFWISQDHAVKMCGIFANGIKEKIKAEEFYMKQSLGFVGQGESHGMVCRKQKALYDLKQSHRAWFGRLSSVLLDFDMLHNKVDHSVYYKHKSTNQCIYLVVCDWHCNPMRWPE